MNISSKRIIAIAAAFTLGLILSNTLLAQEPTQIQRLEQSIAQLQAELAELKAQQKPTSPTTWSLPPSSTVQESTNGRLIAPGYDARETIVAQEVLPPLDAQNTPSVTLPGDTIPQASVAPTLAAPGVQVAPGTSQIIPTQPGVIGSTIIQPRPTYILPYVEEYCPHSGQLYHVQRPIYLQYQPVPRFQYEWDYFDEDRAARRWRYDRYDD